jgi:hypothetical protein
MRWLILCAVILSNPGCFYGGPSVEKIVQESVKAQPVKIQPPAPLAKEIDMLIIEGDLIRCDAGCEQLLREYDGARQAILKAWPP